eukprot:166179-Hanusia_phi.AAC.3
MARMKRQDTSLVDRAWVQVAFRELSVLTSLAVLAFVMQYSVFFFLMFSWPGIRLFGLPWCDSLFFISDKLAADKGTASVMVISSVMSWMVLTTICCKNDLWVNRAVTNFLALVGFTGVVCVVLFDNVSGHGDLHLVGAGMMSVCFVLADLNLSIQAYTEETASDTAKFIGMFLSYCSAASLLLYGFLYFWDPCVSDSVLVEYITYLLTSAANLAVYIDFTAMHAYAKVRLSEERISLVGK